MDEQLLEHIVTVKLQRRISGLDDVQQRRSSGLDDVHTLPNMDVEQPAIDVKERSERVGLATSKGLKDSKSGEREQTAILLLDFQNEFAKIGGKLHEAVSEVMEETGMLQKVPELVDIARKMGALVIYSPVVMKVGRKFDKISEEESTSSKKKYLELDGLFTENTWNCDIIHELEPKKDDFILNDRSDYSAFAGTKLSTILKRNHVKNLYVMGYQTDVCVLDTVKDASDLAPDVSTYVVADGCATASLDEHDSALDNSIVKYANVVTCATAKMMIANFARHQSAVDDDRNSDEWLLVEKIFSAAGADDETNIEIDMLLSIIRIASKDSPIFSVVSSALQNMKTEGDESLISRENLHKIIFQRRIRSTFLEKLPILLLGWFIPFFYSFSTSLPMIFLGVEVIKREGTFSQVGIILGLYQTSRAVANMLIVVAGGDDPFKRLEILMVLLGLFGWVFLAVFTELTSIWWLLALCGVGLSETIVNLQRSLVIETEKETPAGIADESLVASRLGMQFSSAPCGSVAAFVGGGYVYENLGFSYTCWLGAMCNVAQLVGACLYLCLASKSTKKAIAGDNLDGTDTIRSMMYQFQAASIITEHADDVARGASNALGSHPKGFTAAVKKAKGDHVLTHSLTQMYKNFFGAKEGGFKEDPVLCMHDMLEQISSTRNEELSTNRPIDSKRPAVMAVQKKEVAKLLVFLMQSRGEEKSLKADEFVSYWAPRVYLSMYGSAQASSVDVVWPYMRVIVFTQAIMALCIGSILSMSNLMYETFELGTDKVGLLLGLGEGAGMVCLLLRSVVSTMLEKRKSNNTTTRWRSGYNCSGILVSIVARPLHVPFILFVTGIASMGFAIPYLPVAIVFQLIISTLGDFSVTLLNELIGTSLPASKFKYYAGIGQWLRRLGNMVAGGFGPLLFGVYKGLPFLIFGCLTFIWALIVWRLLYVQGMNCELSNNDNDEEYNKSTRVLRSQRTNRRNINPCMGLFQPFLATSIFPWHVLEQKYYSVNKDEIEDKLNTKKKLGVDVALLEHSVRRMGAALQVEQSQRRALEDRIHAAQFHEGQKDKGQ